MKTQIKTTGDTIVVTMDGKIDFEATGPLREDLSRLMRQNRTDSVPKKIIFNLEKLDFVGSSGISSFVQALKAFNTGSTVKPRYCHVKSEFQKVIKAFDESEGFEFYDNEERAKRSFDC
jgi:anti-anti-sigma factor